MYYIESYNDQFQEIAHYRKMPQMMPWVGKSYGDVKVKKILFIGESHYLPENSKIHKDSEKWYKINYKEMKPTELIWTSTAKIIANKYGDVWNDKGWNKAHNIYKNIEEIIKITGSNLESKQMLEFCAFYNYFQRPAQEKGQSIIYDSKDLEVADEVFLKIVKTIRPEYIFVTSSKVWPYVKEKSKELEIISDFSPHPGCAWWNRRAKKYGTNSDGKYLNGKGKVIIFLKEHSVFNTY